MEKQKHIHYLEELEHYDALKLIKGSNILILPSYIERFPTVILELMFLGTLMVASNIPEIKGIMPQAQLREASYKIVMNACKIILERYIWNRVIIVIENIYKRDAE